MSHLDDFQDNLDDWDTDEDEQADQFPVDNDDNAPVFNKATAGSKTIFVTQQFRHFSDDYVIVKPIGEPGQFGIAYECYLKNDKTQTRRCVKEINKARFHHIGADERNVILKTMQNEIAILKKVDHPNIVKLYDVYEDRHKLHLVMEFLPGGELFARICEKDSFSEKLASNTIKEILTALDHMHEENILHLDLKPDNILFSDKSDNSPIKLIDFGMARVVPRLAKLKDRVGTPNYMAPEVLSGSYSKAADIWSCGVILFCMLFGYPPFYVDSDDAIHMDENTLLEEKIKQGFEPIVKDGFGAWFPKDIPISENCRYLIGKMLEIDVKKRWTTKQCLSSQWVRGFASTKTIPPIVRDALKKFHSTTKFKVAISNLFKTQVDPDHIAEMKKFFSQLDTDGDGTISLQEFKLGMTQKFNSGLDDDQLEKIFENVDLDKDKTISFDELMTITAHSILVDEDERLYQAFQDLDQDGNGLISKVELEQALHKFDTKHNKHQKRKSMMMLKRFSSAFGGADINNDGQIDYEEFLKVIHPDFGDQTMDLDDFKHSVMDTGTGTDRVRGPSWNVDFSSATPGTFMEPQNVSPKHKPVNPNPNPMDMKKKTLPFNAFKAKSTNNLEDDDEQKYKDKIIELETKYQLLQDKYTLDTDKLNDKIDNISANRDDIRDKYEKQIFEMLNKFELQQDNISKMRNEFEQTYKTKLKDKNDLLLQKDQFINDLNSTLNDKNQEIIKQNKQINSQLNDLKDVRILLKQSIDSKMKSLINSQNEISKLRLLLYKKSSNNSLLSPSSISPKNNSYKPKINHSKSANYF